MATMTKAKNTQRRAVPKDIPVADLTLDPRCQPRDKVSDVVATEYAEDMLAGAAFPAITVFQIGKKLLVVDGWHRVMATQKAERETILADVRKGTIRQAVLFSLSANATHGQRRTNADKRRAVQTLLDDTQWAKRSDSWIAKQVAVSHVFVGKIRKAAGVTVTTRTGADGRTTDTSKVAAKQAATKAKTKAANKAAKANGVNGNGKAKTKPHTKAQVRKALLVPAKALKDAFTTEIAAGFIGKQAADVKDALNKLFAALNAIKK